MEQSLNGSAAEDISRTPIGKPGLDISLRVKSSGGWRAHVNGLVGIKGLKKAERIVPEDITVRHTTSQHKS